MKSYRDYSLLGDGRWWMQPQCCWVGAVPRLPSLVLENAYCSTWACSVTGRGDLAHGIAVCGVIILPVYKGASCGLASGLFWCVGQPVVVEIYETRGGICCLEHFELEMAACHPSWETPFSWCLLNCHQWIYCALANGKVSLKHFSPKSPSVKKTAGRLM